MQSGDGENVRESGVAQRLFVVLRNAAAIAGNQRGCDRTGAPGQHRVDAGTDVEAQRLQRQSDSAPDIGRGRRPNEFGRTEGVSDCADAFKPGGAPEIVIAGL